MKHRQYKEHSKESLADWIINSALLSMGLIALGSILLIAAYYAERHG